MIRRTFLSSIGAFALSLFTPKRPDIPLFGSKILSVSVFSGQGNMTNINTGLKYNGVSVSPTFVSVTPTGYHVTASVGWNSHQSDTKVDIQITGGNTWTACAYYIQ